MPEKCAGALRGESHHVELGFRVFSCQRSGALQVPPPVPRRRNGASELSKVSVRVTGQPRPPVENALWPVVAAGSRSHRLGPHTWIGTRQSTMPLRTASAASTIRRSLSAATAEMGRRRFTQPSRDVQEDEAEAAVGIDETPGHRTESRQQVNLIRAAVLADAARSNSGGIRFIRNSSSNRRLTGFAHSHL
jgi:hypothetical protein